MVPGKGQVVLHVTTLFGCKILRVPETAMQRPD